MIPSQNMKVINVTPPAAIVDDGSYATTEVDTLGFDYATFIISMGATDIAMAALKVQESDVSATGLADIDGADFAGDTDVDGAAATVPSATDDNKVFIVELDLRNRKRYLDLVATAGDGTAGSFMSCVCLLSRSKSGLETATERGADIVLRV